MNKKQTRGNIAPDHHLWGCRGLRIARWIICVISKEQKTLTTTCLLRKTFLALLMVHAHMQNPSKCVKCKPLYPQVQFWEAVDCFSNPNIVFFFRRQRLVSRGCKRTGFFVPLLFLLQVSFTRETHIQTRIFFPIPTFCLPFSYIYTQINVSGRVSGSVSCSSSKNTWRQKPLGLNHQPTFGLGVS